jgi:hypothetical protein
MNKKHLQENANMPIRASPLQEVTTDFSLELRELAGGKSQTVVKATVAKAGIVNRNGRYYSKEVYQKAVDEAQADMKAGKLIGLLGHPSWDEPLKGKPENTAIKWTSLEMSGDDVKAEGILVGTTAGKEVAALAEAKVALGLSTNGVGSAKYQKAKELSIEGLDPDTYVAVIQDDYRIATIDVVNDPSNIYGQIAQESENKNMTLEELKAKHAALVEQVKAEALAGVKPVDNSTEIKALETRLIALETENKTLKQEQATATRKAIAEAALTEAKLPVLGKSGEIDLDARFKKQLEQAAISATSDDEAKTEVTALIAERKALVGTQKQEAKGNNKPGITANNKPQTSSIAMQLGI